MQHPLPPVGTFASGTCRLTFNLCWLLLSRCMYLIFHLLIWHQQSDPSKHMTNRLPWIKCCSRQIKQLSCYSPFFHFCNDEVVKIAKVRLVEEEEKILSLQIPIWQFPGKEKMCYFTPKTPHLAISILPSWRKIEFFRWQGKENCFLHQSSAVHWLDTWLTPRIWKSRARGRGVPQPITFSITFWNFLFASLCLFCKFWK